MSINNNIFIILIIFINLTKITKENEKLRKERIFWTIKELFNSIESNILDDFSISLYYVKYKIKFSYLKINNAPEKAININEIEENIFTVKNLSFNIIYNNYILFDDKNDNLKYEDLQKQIEIKFNEISFYEGTNFLFLYNTNIDSVIVPKIEKISKFRFFKDYNEEKVNPFLPDISNYCNFEEAVSWSLNNIFLNRIDSLLFSSINVYLYDFNQIMEMSKNISYKNTKHDYLENLNYIYISQFEMSKDGDYQIELSYIYIQNLKLKGNFTFDDGDFVEFNAYLRNDGEITMDAQHGIEFYNRRKPFLIEPVDPELKKFDYQYSHVFHLKYLDILENNSLIYFNNLYN